MKYVGAVIDDSYWEAVEDMQRQERFMEYFESIKKQSIEVALKKYGWVRD